MSGDWHTTHPIPITITTHAEPEPVHLDIIAWLASLADRARTQGSSADHRCEGCASPFPPDTHPTRRYCTDPCRLKHQRRTRGVPTRCSHCGATFLANPDRRLYCTGRCQVTAPNPKHTVTIVPWAACRYCEEWFIARNGRTHCQSRRCTLYLRGVHTPPGSVTANCQQCGQPFTYDRVTRTRRFCTTACSLRTDKDAFVETVYRSRIYKRDGWRCQLCRRAVDPHLAYPHPRCASLDHVIPLSRGGTHEPANCQLAHLECNIAKGNSATATGEQLRLAT